MKAGRGESRGRNNSRSERRNTQTADAGNLPFSNFAYLHLHPMVIMTQLCSSSQFLTHSFWFLSPTISLFSFLSPLFLGIVFQPQQAAVFSKKALIKLLYTSCPNSRRTKLATYWCLYFSRFFKWMPVQLCVNGPLFTKFTHSEVLKY